MYVCMYVWKVICLAYALFVTCLALQKATNQKRPEPNNKLPTINPYYNSATISKSAIDFRLPNLLKTKQNGQRAAFTLRLQRERNKALKHNQNATA